MADRGEPVIREIDIDASPETIFEFFVDADKLTRWLAAEATLDPRPGGVCDQVHVGDEPGPGRWHMRGTYLEVDRPTRVVFSWGFVEPEIGVPVGSSTVEVTLQPVDAGSRVRLVHHGLPDAEIDSHVQGWAEMLNRLADAARSPAEASGSRNERTREITTSEEEQTVNSMEHEVWLDAPREKVFAALTTSEGLDGWWGKVIDAEPRVGSVVEFDHGLGAPLRMEITELVPNERLTWKCISAFSDPSNPASEWNGQTFRFELAPRGHVELLGTKHDVTVLRLQVTGWPKNARWYGFCNSAWGQTLSTNLKNSVT